MAQNKSESIDKIEALDALLYLLYYSGGRVEGRTKLEKMLILLKNKYNVMIPDLEVDREYYGPSSSEFKDFIGRALIGELIEEELIPLNETKVIFKHAYKLTSTGKAWLRVFGKEYSDEVKEKIKKVATEYSKKDELEAIKALEATS
jgi:hypothetical protein